MREDRRVRRITYDFEGKGVGPKKGNFLVSVGKRGIGTVYLIHRVRKVERRVVAEARRFLLYVEVVGGKDEFKKIGETPVFYLHWYVRKKRKLTFEEYMKQGAR